MFLVISVLLSLSSHAQAQLMPAALSVVPLSGPEKTTPNPDKEIASLIQRIASRSFSERLEKSSSDFVHRPYLNNGPLGEGKKSPYDRDPLYRTNGFDCTTYVETSIAIAQAHDFKDFKKIINQIRYHNGIVNYTERNHFVEIDWIPNNQALGIVQDITSSIGSSNQREMISQIFDKSLWYQAKDLSALVLPGFSEAELQTRLTQLRNEGKRFHEQTNSLTVILKSELSALLPTIQAPAILNIVKHLNTPPAGMPSTIVTHQVLLVEEKVGDRVELRIRQATSRTSIMQVIDLSLDEFLATPLITSAATVGVNVLQVKDLGL